MTAQFGLSFILVGSASAADTLNIVFTYHSAR
jgi:hypothetical protein